MTDAEQWPAPALVGQLEAAERVAPDDANDLQILEVGYRAWQDRDTDVRELWEEVSDE